MIFLFSILKFNLPGNLSLFFPFLYYMHTIFVVKFIDFVVDLGRQKVHNWNNMET